MQNTLQKAKRKRRLKRLLYSLLAMVVLFFVIDIISPVKTDIEYAPIIRYADESPMYMFLTEDEQWRMKADLSEISPDLKKAIIAKEDKYFYYHFGVNPIAVARAFWNNTIQRKRTSGASTITMQVARMLQPKKRNYFNKISEMFRAVQLEVHYSKEEILQMYLNLIPFGSNIQGVKAASILYLNKYPEQLSLAEITALSIIPNRPNTLVIGKDNEKVIQERNKWLKRFAKEKLFSESIINDALEEPLNAYRHEVPREAPQLAWNIRKAYPGKHDITTTLQNTLQQKAQTIVYNYVQPLKQYKINNAAVIVIDNKSKEVKAYIGSSDFFDTKNHGQVDGVQAMRSPGSALKPYLYALAMDKGMITPKTIIADVPIDINGYRPENYDLQFRGNISAENALKNSLNIPAVKLLNQYGVQNYVQKMQAAGFYSFHKEKQKVGLSLILGGCVVRLSELSNLYAAFANEGKFNNLIYSKEQTKQQDSIQIISKSAAWMLTNMLKELHRPDLPNNYVNAVNIPQIAWKTGTSYGRKDAWSVGYNEHFTIGVWVGNFNGAGAPEINGAGIATPLLFQLFNTIDSINAPFEPKMPQELDFRNVCVETGFPINDFCKEQITDYFIPGISTNNTCEHVKEFAVSADETISYCTSCVPATGYKTKVYPNIIPEIQRYYISKNISFAKAPPHNPECSRNFEGEAPIINSLTENTTYLITDKGKQKLQLSCMAAIDATKVYWYVNDKLIGSCAKEEKLFFIPEEETLKISCTDDKGRNRNIKIKVKFI